ncbi:MAG: dephospho-CoA kinase [Acidimicrobiia bacterium]|nr:dephospho-CoA kinase [Acidimicrobiia bacterium]
MIEFGLTGGIGSGKSTVAELLVAEGAVLIDADAIVRELQEPGQPVFEAMVERWGQVVVADDGRLDRAKVADIVFGDEDDLKALNDIVHPAVGKEMIDRRKALEGTDTVVINDIPLLVRQDGSSEREGFDTLRGIIVVDTPAEVAVQRLVEFRGYDEDDARARIANQASREDRLAVADFVVDNGGPLDALLPQIDECWAWIQSVAADHTDSG